MKTTKILIQNKKTKKYYAIKEADPKTIYDDGKYLFTENIEEAHDFVSMIPARNELLQNDLFECEIVFK